MKLNIPRDIIGELWREPELGRLYLYLADKSDESGKVIVSRTKTMCDLGLSERRFKTLISKLKTSAQVSAKTSAKTSALFFDFSDSYAIRPSAQVSAKTSAKTSAKKPAENTDSKAVSTTPKTTEKFDYKAFWEYFNKAVALTQIPQLKKFEDNRKRLIRNILKEYTKQDIAEVLKKVVNSNWLNGTSGDWICSFDWIFTKKNFIKILEGTYDNNNKQQRTNYTTNRVNPPLTDKERAEDLADLAQIIHKRNSAGGGM